MINFKHKFVLIHVPKTGGSSFRYQLDQDSFEDKFKFGHASAKDHMDYLGEDYKEYFSFAITRNPWDRLVSSFFYLQKGGSQGKYDLKMEKKLSKFKSFEDFICADSGLDSFLDEVHFKPQYAMLYEGGECLVDFVGKYEELQQSFDFVCEKLNLKKTTLAHKNKSTHEHYSNCYNDHTIKIVADKYSKDIRKYNYIFENI
jgi:hypothetical protein